MEQQNPKSILFLYEGDTEREFYDIIFNKYLTPRKIRITQNNLKGIFNINKKVEGRIIFHLDNHPERKQIYVFIAIDREGPKKTALLINLQSLKTKFLKHGSRIKSINTIIATQDIESWVFYDIEGIYKFLKVPFKERHPQNYSDVEKTNNIVLSQLFRKYGRLYSKGTRVQGFLKSIDMNKIYSKCFELKKGIEEMRKLYENKLS
jgi:hypothetical protein